MRLISWNVNGIRAVQKKGFGEFVEAAQPDLLLLQEVKARREQVELPESMADWHVSWNPAEKPGYSGVASFSRTAPVSVRHGIGVPEHDREGRVLTLEYADFCVVNVYTPNAQNELRRLGYRLEWNAAFLAYLKELERDKPVVFAGDLNVAHREIDLARPAQNRKSAGFSDEERAGFDDLVAAGFVDTFRHFHPEEAGRYTWWSYRAGARGKNIGWRIDYFCVSPALLPRVRRADILAEVHGSDHCPVLLELE